MLESSLVEVDRIESESEEAVSQIPKPYLEKKESTDGTNSEIVNETIRQVDGADEVQQSEEIVTNNNTISTEDYMQDSDKPLAK